MANAVVHPEGKYKLVNVGPSRPFSFQGNDGPVTLVEYQVQFDGIADWVKMNTPDGAPAPQVGEDLEGQIEDTGKYGYKFVKARKTGTWSGGAKKNYAGAHYNAAMSVAADIVIGYYQLKGDKPESINELMDKIEQVTTKVKMTVDKLAGTDKDNEYASDQQSLNASAPAQPAAGQQAVTSEAVITDVSEKELNW